MDAGSLDQCRSRTRNSGFWCRRTAPGSTWSHQRSAEPVHPWSNDPVANPPAEVAYIRDEESGELWSATPLPIREPAASYIVRHGFGYSRFEHTSRGIASDLLQFVPKKDSIKISRLKIANRSNKIAAALGHPLCGVGARQSAHPHGALHRHGDRPRDRALLARNPWSADFPGRVAFIGYGRPATDEQRRPAGIPGSLRLPGRAGRAPRPSRLVQSGRRRTGSVRRVADPVRTADRARRRRS